MNKLSYRNYIVNKRNCFCKSGTIPDYLINYYKQKANDWDMKIETFSNWNGMLTRYSVGYSLYPMDYLYYLKYNRSETAPWVNVEWLPYWGNLTLKKAKMLKSIINYDINRKKVLLYLKFNVSEIIDLIFETVT